MDGTMVRLDEDQYIVNFISKQAFDYADVDSYYKTVNIYKFSREFLQQQYVPFLDAYTKAVGNNEYYENVLRIISLLKSTTSRISTSPRPSLPTIRTSSVNTTGAMAVSGDSPRCSISAIW